jgi:hypothetical protein
LSFEFMFFLLLPIRSFERPLWHKAESLSTSFYDCEQENPSPLMDCECHLGYFLLNMTVSC